MITATGLTDLGWALVHSLWQGTLLVALLAAAAAALRPHPASVCRVGTAAVAVIAAMPTANILLLRPDFITPVGAAAPLPVVGADWLGPPLAVLAPWFAGAWCLATAAAAVRLAAGCLLTARRLSRCRPPSSALIAIGGSLPAPARASLRSVADPGTLGVSGFVSPRILVPDHLVTALPADDLRALLAHEAAHLRRRDPLLNLVLCSLEVVLWYHPAVRWLLGHVRGAVESCCDDDAVAWSGSAHGYAQALLRIAEYERGRSVARHALAAAGRGLVERIRRLVSHPGPAPRARPLVTATATALAAALIGRIGSSAHLGDLHSRALARETWMSISGDEHRILQVLPHVTVPDPYDDATGPRGGCLFVAGPDLRIEIDAHAVTGDRAVRGDQQVTIRDRTGTVLWDLRVSDGPDRAALVAVRKGSQGR